MKTHTSNTIYITNEVLDNFITSAFEEDIQDGDHSSLASVPENAINSARLIIKDSGIIAGLSLTKKIFNKFDNSLTVDFFLKDGDEVNKGEIGFIVKGKARSILSAERLVLNCLQRMSGIATYTHNLSQLLEGTKAKLLDTRKTTPNFRLMEKWAVNIGGGLNHRFGLFDMIMLKDNHNDFAGGITNAVNATVEYLKLKNKSLKIEVETRNLKEVREALSTRQVDIIMLDNMSLDMMKEAVKLIGSNCKIEASGGITEDTIKSVAKCGVDYISVGALTHSIKSIDMSLKAV